ncbi:beta galactofuranosyl glycosyltransferase [Trypanosoma rangeli SC58]|uniref:Beta galactofuranosyl glycosyltransferase n=1 Tax=Trypanosoma rangeli SC58 TaxID=429131 RepID=A0A061IW61_TRYRA|nr:beta galactofuranosyl glycosyltransferase [Trypanosoma rangeli SC58]ESL05267.1 beta galactofuranosyl glycosyltransferase [Trypanosoma rangeli SC58]
MKFLRRSWIKGLLLLNLLVMGSLLFFGWTEPKCAGEGAWKSSVAPRIPKHMMCVGERLLVDAKTGKLGDASGKNVIPLMVVPLMLDLGEFKNMMCNISAPIRRLLLVQNGEEAELQLYLQELEKIYGWTGRLIVKRHPENIGYSGAANIGLRLALSLSREEAPFVFVTNSDVTFSPEIFPNLLNDTYTMTKHDAARMDELAAEVANEPNEHSRGSRRKMKVLRSTPKDNLLSTSALLPDRVRYAPPDVRGKEFSQHYGCFCVNDHGACFTSVMLTRLAISTVGYFDENFYPAYFEDVEYGFRLKLLGFKERHIKYGTFVHQTSLNVRLSAKLKTKEAIWFRRVRPLGATYKYALAKWGRTGMCCGGYEEPFNGTIPVDVWVKDAARIRRIQAYGHGEWKRVPNVGYDTSLLEPVMTKS